MAGKLVVFEGIDGTGKSTSARNSAAHFAGQGWKTVLLREPTDGPCGVELRRIMLSGEPRDARREFDLFLQDREEDVERNIRPALERGALVLLDRYYFSNIAYQGALGLDEEMIREANEKIAVKPDLALYFRADLDRALERIARNRPEGFDSFENREYLARVVEGFERVRFSPWVVVDANRPIGEVRDRVVGAIEAILNPPGGPVP